jgi:hypothetical protein
MTMKRVILWTMPDEIMLLIGCPSGVVYQNQVGGVVCWQAEIEGILSPLDVEPDGVRRIMQCAYPSGREGITREVADAIDAILSNGAATRFLKVDRSRLDRSWEAWVYVLVDSPGVASGDVPKFSPVQGFGQVGGVLTWPNSD